MNYMKILVFSDSHGTFQGMEKAISLHPDAEYCLHLGDGYREFELLSANCPGKCFFGVAGNLEDYRMADSFGKPSSDAVLDINGYRIFLTHGHKYYVKDTLYRAKCAAEEKNADILLHGHTHRPFFDTVETAGGKPLYIFCPGSISLPYGGSPEYGIIRITSQGVSFDNAVL